MNAEYKLCLGEDSIHVYNSLKAEEKSRGPEKGSVKIMLDDDCVVIVVESRTLSGLRALSNSFLLLAHSAYSAIRSAGRSSRV